MAYYTELLALCGFDEAEIQSETQRVERSFEILNLGPQDMERAIARVQEYFDIELMGVRKVLGIWLKDLFDLVLAKEEHKTVIYFGYPPFQYIGLAIKTGAQSKNDIYVGCPEIVVGQTLGQMFDKTVPILEAGEAAGLPPGHAMCSLLQIKLGAIEKGIIPIPDLSIATSYFCDMGPKADELMQYKYGYPVEYVDSCMDSAWGEYPQYDRERVRYFGARLNDLFTTLKTRFDIEINDKSWDEARDTARKVYLARNRLSQYLGADPVPLSTVDLEMIFTLTTGCTGVAMEEGPGAIEMLVEEAGDRVRNGVGAVAKGAPRVIVFLQSVTDPAINRLVEEVGLAVPINMALVAPFRPSKPYAYNTLGEKRAEQAMSGGAYHSTYGWIKRNTEIIRSADVDGVIWTYPFSCRPIACHGKLHKMEIEKVTGLPTLLVEMDLYDNRNYSAAALRTRFEAFAEMLKARKLKNRHEALK